MKGTGLTRQLEMATDYCKKAGLALSSQTFRDLGVSGYSGRNVKAGALRQFIALVEAGRIAKGSALILEGWDRWSRQQPAEAITDLQLLLRLGVEVHTVQDGKVYTRESLGANIGDLFYSIAVMSRAHDESLTKSRRGLDNWKRKRATASTKPLTKGGPGWLTLVDGKWKVDKARAKVVQRVFALVAEGYGREAIAKTLNAEHVPLPTRRGKDWHAGTIFKLLASPSVIGQFQPKKRDGWRSLPDGDVIEGYYPAIIPRALWLKTRKTATQFPKGPSSHYSTAW